VNQVYSLDLELVEDGYVVDLASTNYIKIKVKNTGNGQDTITLQPLENNIPNGWNIYFSSVETSETVNNTKNVDFSQVFSITGSEKTRYKPSDDSKISQISMTMLSGQNAFVIIEVVTPQKGSWGNNSFVIYGETSNFLNKDSKPLTVPTILKTSDLEFVGKPELSAQNLTVGDTLSIDLQIRNNYHTSASNFQVKLYQVKVAGQEDTLIESKSIDNVAPNSTHKVTLRWNVPKNSPEGTYLFMIKMEGAILPSNDLPEKFVTVSVLDKDDDSEDNSLLFLLIIIIIVILVVIIVLFAVIRKSKEVRESESKPEPEPYGTKPTMDFSKRRKSPVKTVKPKKPIVK
jgi:hypothetical protein